MANHAELIRDMYPSRAVTGRGRRYIEFDLGGGQKRRVITIEPLHTANNQEINTTWLPDSGAWQWKLASTDYQAHARSVFNAGNLIEWRIGGEWIIFDPQSINWINQDTSRQQIAIKQAVTGTANDATLSFTNAYGAGRHFEYIAHPARLIKHITLDSLASLPAPTVTGTIWFEAEFRLSTSSNVEFWLDGIRWAKTNGVRVRTANRIEFRNAQTGAVLWLAEAPYAADANGDVQVAEYEVRRQGGQSSLFITVRLPREWLLSAAYPVKIDPTLDVQPDATAGKDTKVNGTNTTRNYGITANLLSATNEKELIEFDASSIPATATCNSATLSLFQSGTSAALAFTLTAYSIASGNAAWVEGAKNAATATAGESCWDYLAYNTVAWAGSAGLSTSGTDYEASALGTDTGNRSDVNGTEYAISLTTSRVAGWFGASNTNYGVLVVTSAGCGTLASSDHATAAYRPRLVIVYTEAGGTDALTAAGITTTAPTLDAPTFGQTHVLTAAGIDTGQPVLSAPTFGQAHALTAAGIVTGSPVLDAPTLGQVHVLTAGWITTATPILDAPSIGQVHNLSAAGIVTGAPTLGAPTLEITPDSVPGRVTASDASIYALSLSDALIGAVTFTDELIHTAAVMDTSIYAVTYSDTAIGTVAVGDSDNGD